jgi:adenosylhomocysteine nucleosidase
VFGSDRTDVIMVMTALDLEYMAVRAHLTGVRPYPHPQGNLFEVGDLPGSGRRIALAVVGSGTRPLPR